MTTYFLLGRKCANGVPGQSPPQSPNDLQNSPKQEPKLSFQYHGQSPASVRAQAARDTAQLMQTQTSAPSTGPTGNTILSPQESAPACIDSGSLKGSKENVGAATNTQLSNTSSMGSRKTTSEGSPKTGVPPTPPGSLNRRRRSSSGEGLPKNALMRKLSNSSLTGFFSNDATYSRVDSPELPAIHYVNANVGGNSLPRTGTLAKNTLTQSAILNSSARPGMANGGSSAKPGMANGGFEGDRTSERNRVPAALVSPKAEKPLVTSPLRGKPPLMSSVTSKPPLNIKTSGDCSPDTQLSPKRGSVSSSELAKMNNMLQELGHPPPLSLNLSNTASSPSATYQPGMVSPIQVTYQRQISTPSGSSSTSRSPTSPCSLVMSANGAVNGNSLPRTGSVPRNSLPRTGNSVAQPQQEAPRGEAGEGDCKANGQRSSSKHTSNGYIEPAPLPCLNQKNIAQMNGHQEPMQKELRRPPRSTGLMRQISLPESRDLMASRGDHTQHNAPVQTPPFPYLSWSSKSSKSYDNYKPNYVCPSHHSSGSGRSPRKAPLLPRTMEDPSPPPLPPPPDDAALARGKQAQQQRDLDYLRRLCLGEQKDSGATRKSSTTNNGQEKYAMSRDDPSFTPFPTSYDLQALLSPERLQYHFPEQAHAHAQLLEKESGWMTFQQHLQKHLKQKDSEGAPAPFQVKRRQPFGPPPRHCKSLDFIPSDAEDGGSVYSRSAGGSPEIPSSPRHSHSMIPPHIKKFLLPDNISLSSLGSSEMSKSDPAINYDSGSNAYESEYDNYRPGMASDEDYFVPEPISDIDIDYFDDIDINIDNVTVSDSLSMDMAFAPIRPLQLQKKVTDV